MTQQDSDTNDVRDASELTRRDAMKTGGSAGLVTLVPKSLRDLGGGPEADAMSEYRVPTYRVPESDLDTPGVVGREVTITSGGSTYQTGDQLVDLGDRWELVSPNYGSVSAGSADITEPTSVQSYNVIPARNHDHEPTPTTNVQNSQHNLVLRLGATNDWDDTEVGCGAFVPLGGGKIAALYFGSDSDGGSDPVSWQIGLAISYDLGETWIKHPNNPVITTSNTSDTWDEQMVVGTSIVRTNDKWRLYAHGQNLNDDTYSIGVFESSDLVSWSEPVTNPVLKGTDVGLSEDWISNPSVVKYNGTYHIAFAYKATQEIYGATSSDGLSNWSAVNNGDPIIPYGSSGADTSRIQDPCIVKVGDTWYSTYGTGEKSDGDARISLAKSDSFDSEFSKQGKLVDLSTNTYRSRLVFNSGNWLLFYDEAGINKALFDQASATTETGTNVKIFKDTTQGLDGASTQTSISWNAKQYDEKKNMSLSDDTLTVRDPGYYLVSGQVQFTGLSQGDRASVYVMVNGVKRADFFETADSGGSAGVQLSTVVELPFPNSIDGTIAFDAQADSDGNINGYKRGTHVEIQRLPFPVV